MDMPYKLLLVDDEEEVRRAVIQKLDWAALGFVVAGEASNGEEALEMIEKLSPDVIMTDIKMPFMDGLELCRRAKKLLPGVRTAILSGFDEFEYAREAITQQVEDYILKPIDAQSLSAVFLRIRQSIDQEVASRRDMERLRRHYEESLPMMRQQVLLELISGRPLAQMTQDHLAEYGLDIQADAYCAAIVGYERMAGENRLLSLSLRELVGDTLANLLRHHLLYTPDHIVVLFLLDANISPVQINDALNRLFPECKRLLGINLHIGLGKAYPRAEDLARSYREACSALEYRFLLSPGQCIYIGDIEPDAGLEQMPDPCYADELIRQIKIGSREDLQAAVGSLIHQMQIVNATPQQYQIYLLELFTGLMKVIRSYRMDEKAAGLDTLLSEGMSMRFNDLDALKHWLVAFCENLRRLARQERKDTVRLLIDKAKDILQNNYMDSELNLENVCAQLNVSTAYFSTIFKKETGQGFVGYLTGLRMERALELLHNSDDKTYQIAEKIGYGDPNYFSYVFKKKFGISPSRYRTNGMNQHAKA